MANELSIVVSVAFSKEGMNTQRSESISVTVGGDAFTHQVQTITTKEELDKGDAIDTTGYVFIKNLDADHYVDVGVTAGYSIRLNAGEIALFRAAGVLFAEAESAESVNIEYWIIEA